MTTQELVSASSAQGTAPEVARIVTDLRGLIDSGQLSCGAKLLPEKKLAASYGTTIHTIRKVLKQLRDESYVYSRPKFGFFVSDRGSSVHSEELPSSPLDLEGSESSTIRFVTQSFLQGQQRIFTSAADAFRKTAPTCDLVISPSLLGEGITHDVAQDTDMVENSSPFFYYRNRDTYVDLKKYFGSQLEVSARDNFSLPLFYSTMYVCYNPKLLKDLGFSQPAWRNYDEQNSYLETATDYLKKHQLSIPGTSFSALQLLGQSLTDLFAAIRDFTVTEDSFIQRFVPAIRKATDYWRHYQISFPRQGIWCLQEFTEGRTPFVYCNSTKVLGMREEHPDFQFEVYPYLTIDNRLPRLTHPLSILKTTSHLVECVRFLRELQGETIQRQAAAMGYVPIHEEYYSSMPAAVGGFKGSDEMFFVTPEDFYIGVNILNVELWNIILLGKDAEEAMRDSLLYARAYLSFQVDVETQKRQNEHGQIFL